MNFMSTTQNIISTYQIPKKQKIYTQHNALGRAARAFPVLPCAALRCVASIVASAGKTDRDLAVTQSTKNCVAYNIMEF